MRRLGRINGLGQVNPTGGEFLGLPNRRWGQIGINTAVAGASAAAFGFGAMKKNSTLCKVGMYLVGTGLAAYSVFSTVDAIFAPKSV